MASTWKKGLGAVLSVSALGLLLVGCGASTGSTNNSSSNGTGASSSKPVEGGNIVIEETQGLRDLDPAVAYDTQSDEVTEQLYDQLVTYAPGANSTKIVPMDATSWTISPDGKTYTFTIRKGMTFWNGDPVTAQSFIDEIQRVATKSLGSGGEYFVENIVGEQAFYNKKAKTISGLSAPNKYTLKIQLTQPNADELMVLAMPFFSPVDMKFINQYGNKTFDSTKAMGDGPFELKSISSTQVVLTKNPNYWMTDKYGNKLPYLNQVTINVNTNPTLIGEDFQKGNTAFLGMAQAIPSNVFPTFENTPSLKKLLTTQDQNSVYYLGLNNNIAPFNNKTVRQAMEYAIDKQAIVKLFNGRGIVANQPLPPNVPGYEKNLPSAINYTYDPTKAKALLKKAGINPSTYPALTLYSSNDSDQLKEDQVIQSNLQALGFKVNLKATTWGTFLNVAEAGKAQMFELGWIQDYPSAGDFLMLFQTNQAPVNNSSMYSNKQVDSWLAQAASTTNQTQRVQLYDKVVNQVMADAPWVPTYYPVAYFAVQNWVHGWYDPSTLMDPLAHVWIDQSHSAS